MFSQSLVHRVHRVVTAALWRTFHHEGKISPGWWGWGVHAHPLSLHLPSPVKLQSTLQLGRYTDPVSSLVKICTLCSSLSNRSSLVRPPPPWHEAACAHLFLSFFCMQKFLFPVERRLTTQPDCSIQASNQAARVFMNGTLPPLIPLSSYSFSVLTFSLLSLSLFLSFYLSLFHSSSSFPLQSLSSAGFLKTTTFHFSSLCPFLLRKSLSCLLYVTFQPFWCPKRSLDLYLQPSY